MVKLAISALVCCIYLQICIRVLKDTINLIGDAVPEFNKFLCTVKFAGNLILNLVKNLLNVLINV